MHLRRFKAPVALVLAGTLLTTSVSAKEPASNEDPVELIRQGRHLDAAAAFERQYEKTGDAALLFAKATALRRAGDCRGTIETLERFIATEPPEPDVAAAREVIDVCTEILDDGEPAPVRPPVPPPVIVQPEPEVEPPSEPVDETPAKPWTRDVAGGVLLGTGITVVVGGAVALGLGAARTQSREESEAGFERREQSVRTLSAVGGTLVAAGAALIIGSIVRYTVVSRRRSRSTARLR